MAIKEITLEEIDLTSKPTIDQMWETNGLKIEAILYAVKIKVYVSKGITGEINLHRYIPVISKKHQPLPGLGIICNQCVNQSIGLKPPCSAYAEERTSVDLTRFSIDGLFPWSGIQVMREYEKGFVEECKLFVARVYH